MKMLIFSIIVSAGLLSGVSTAAMFVVEPDDFAAEPGYREVELTNAFPGVTFSVANNTGEATPTSHNQIISFEGSNPSTGDWVFGRQLAASVPDELFFDANFTQLISILRADFATPSDYVSIDILNIGSRDSGTLRAYDAFDNLLDSTTVTFGPSDSFLTAEIARPGADIAYVLAAGSFVSGPPFPSVGLDRLVFSSVPEPSTALLLGLGLAGLAAKRR